MTSRLFVALLPPQPFQETVEAIKQEVADRYHSRAAQKSPPHITLQAPFEWDMADIDAIATCLQTVASQYHPLPIVLNGFNAFPPRVIYIHVEPNAYLTALQAALAAELQSSLGIIDPQAQHRDFVPHMTVAFRDLTQPNFDVAWAEFRDRPLCYEFLATHLTLLRHDDQRWNPWLEFPLVQRDNAAN